MTELKRICPFCGSVMVGTNGHPICHSNPDCVIHDESIPQELLDKLETTRKALDVALDAINRTKDWYPTANIMRKALEQINEITKGNK